MTKHMPALAACMLAFSSGASAATITSFSRATFQSALTGGTVSGQNFDAITSGTIINIVNGGPIPHRRVALLSRTSS